MPSLKYALLILYTHFSGRAVTMWSKRKWRIRSPLRRWPKDWEAQAHPSLAQLCSSAWTRDMWMRRGSSTGLAVSNPTRTPFSWGIWPGKMHLSQKWNHRFYCVGLYSPLEPIWMSAKQDLRGKKYSLKFIKRQIKKMKSPDCWNFKYRNKFKSVEHSYL